MEKTRINSLLDIIRTHNDDPVMKPVVSAAAQLLTKLCGTVSSAPVRPVKKLTKDVPEEGERLIQIPGHPMYKASSLGRIWSEHSKKFLKPGWRHDGYHLVNLQVGDITESHIVHVLICTAFHGPKPTPDHQVRHLDGNQGNYRADNLCWGTVEEQAQDKIEHEVTWKQITPYDVKRFANAYKKFLKASREERGTQKAFIDRWVQDLGCSHSVLYDIMRGRTWSDLTGITKKTKVSTKGNKYPRS